MKEIIDSRIKVISYNIHSGKNVWMVPSLHHILSFLKHENPDIIGLQEVNENAKRGYQLTQLKQRLNLNTHFGPNVSIDNGYYGIATLAKYPLLSKEHILLPSGREQRGFIDTIASIAERPVHILNTHLSLKSTERVEQLLLIKDYLSKLTEPFILLGDFNSTISEIDDYLFDVAKKTEKEHLPTMMLYNKRIDYIFVSKEFDILSYDVVPVKMSDHYPVVTELILSN